MIGLISVPFDLTSVDFIGPTIGLLGLSQYEKDYHISIF
jgi:hypothetical protein